MHKFSTSIVKIFLSCLAIATVAASSAMAQHEISIQSDALQETREIIVHFPENYDPNSKEGYPVIYVLDPDFPEDDVAAQGDDLLAQTAHDYHAAGIMPEAIVIGIRNVRRGIDFLPHYYSVTRDGNEVVGNGGKLLEFITNELIPFAGENFRTNGDRVFAGHSWGGQFVTYALSQSPETFDAYFITSPSISDDWREKTSDALKQILEQDLDFPDFIYVSVGGNDNPSPTTGYRNLISLLERHLPKEVTLYHEVNEGQDHSDNRRISQPKALKLYFSTD